MMLDLIERSQVAMATLLVQGDTGAYVSVLNEDGEDVPDCFVAFSDGIRQVKELLPMVPLGGYLKVTGGRFYVPGGRQTVVAHPLHRDSGANPLFQPRSRYDPTIQMEAAVKKLEKRANALVKREQALMKALEARLTETGNAQAEEPAGPVIEPQEAGETGSAAE